MFTESTTTTPDLHNEIDELADRLNIDYASPVAGHLAGPHMDVALEALSAHPVMMGESDVTLLQSPENKAEMPIDVIIAQTREAAGEKAREAIERSEFRGPEVAEAIQGYYQDHTTALKLIERIIEGSPDEAQRITELDDDALGIQSTVLEPAVRTLARLRSLEQADTTFNNLASLTLSTLFTEPCIGQLTLADTDIDAIANEIDQLRQKVGKGSHKEDTVGWINQAKSTAQGEVRMGGQLLFHNTYFGNDVLQGSHKSLRSQAKQHQLVQSGQQQTARATTAEYQNNADSHGDNIHWSEVYDPSSYKRPTAGINYLASDVKAGMMTFAIPLAEVVNKAPFGRGVKYAVVEARPDTISVQPGGRLTGNIGVGSPDAVGTSFGAVDRVFWASDKGYDEAIDYAIPVGGTDAAKMSVYTIQSESDQLENFHQWREGVEQGTTEYEGLQQFSRDHSESELLAQYGGLKDAPEQPPVVTIRDLSMKEGRTAIEAVQAGESILRSDQSGTWQRQAGFAEPVIAQLEQESLARFSGQYVVPLRASRPAFMDRGDNMVSNAYGSALRRGLSYSP